MLGGLEMANDIVVFELGGRQEDRVQERDSCKPPPTPYADATCHSFDDTPSNC